MADRIRDVALGYFAACMTGGFSLALGLFTLTALTGPEWPSPQDFGMIVHVALLAGFVGGFVALAPSLPVILIAEWRGIRWLVPHVLFGAAVGIGGYLALEPAALQGSGQYGPAMIFAAAGALSGLVYHRAAGRSAGARVEA